jgi:hypothetical protein
VEAVGVRDQRHPLRLAGLVAGGAVLVLALAVAATYLWLRTYAPLDAQGSGSYAPGPGLAADVQPVAGSGGKPVFIPQYTKPRLFDTAFTVHNSGRFAVTVTGLAARRAPAIYAAALLATDSPAASADPQHLHPFRDLRLDPGDTAILVVRWQLTCAKDTGEVYSDAVPLRYRYLSIFKRTERIRLPFAVTLRCLA